jgi:hypothetical protein
VEKYDTTRDAIYDNIIQCLHFVCWLAKATDTHSKYVVVVVVGVLVLVVVVVVVIVLVVEEEENSEWFCCVP